MLYPPAACLITCSLTTCALQTVPHHSACARPPQVSQAHHRQHVSAEDRWEHTHTRTHYMPLTCHPSSLQPGHKRRSQLFALIQDTPGQAVPLFLWGALATATAAKVPTTTRYTPSACCLTHNATSAWCNRRCWMQLQHCMWSLSSSLVCVSTATQERGSCTLLLVQAL